MRIFIIVIYWLAASLTPWGQAEPAAILLVSTGDEEIYLMDTLTHESRLIGEGYRPTWSPDGSRFFWYANDNTRQTRSLWLVGADGLNSQSIISVPLSVQLRALWSPDSQHVLWINNEDERTELGIIEVDDSSTRRIREFNGRVRADWSPDSSRLAWTEEGSETTTLYSIRIAAADPDVLLTIPKLSRMNWRWSPDSAHIFLEQHDEFTASPASPYTFHLVDVLENRVTDIPFGHRAAWSPDGHYLGWFTLKSESAERDLWIMPLGQNDPRRLFSVTAESFILWSPDSVSVTSAAVNRPSDMPEMLIAQTETNPTVKIPSGLAVTWTPDGRLLYRASHAPEDDWFLLNLATMETRHLARTSTSTGLPQFSPDGKQMGLASNFGDGQLAIYLIDIAGDTPVQTHFISRQVGRKWSSYAWSPDGDAILFETETTMEGGGDSQFGLVDLCNQTIQLLQINGLNLTHAVWKPIR